MIKLEPVIQVCASLLLPERPSDQKFFTLTVRDSKFITSLAYILTAKTNVLIPSQTG